MNLTQQGIDNLLEAERTSKRQTAYALRTWYKPDHEVPNTEQMNQAALQLASEAGEVAALWAKHLYKPGREISRDDIMDELGDVWYYVRIIAHLYDISIPELTEYNRQKLEGGHGWADSYQKIHNRLSEQAAENEKLKKALVTIAVHTDEDVILSFICKTLEDEVQNG